MKFKSIFNWKFGKYPRKHDKQGSDGKVADFVQKGKVYKLFHWLLFTPHLDDFICDELELPDDYGADDIERRRCAVRKWIYNAREILNAIIYSEDNVPDEACIPENVYYWIDSIWQELVDMEDSF